MIYILSLVFAGLMVLGQACWKTGLQNVTPSAGIAFIFSKEALSLIFTPSMLLGFISYSLAMIIYLLLLHQYDYSVVQSLTIPMTLLGAYFIAALLFKEQISLINLIGLTMIITGVILAVKK